MVGQVESAGGDALLVLLKHLPCGRSLPEHASEHAGPLCDLRHEPVGIEGVAGRPSRAAAALARRTPSATEAMSCGGRPSGRAASAVRAPGWPPSTSRAVSRSSGSSPSSAGMRRTMWRTAARGSSGNGHQATLSASSPGQSNRTRLPSRAVPGRSPDVHSVSRSIAFGSTTTMRPSPVRATFSAKSSQMSGGGIHPGRRASRSRRRARQSPLPGAVRFPRPFGQPGDQRVGSARPDRVTAYPSAPGRRSRGSVRAARRRRCRLIPWTAATVPRRVSHWRRRRSSARRPINGRRDTGGTGSPLPGRRRTGRPTGQGGDPLTQVQHRGRPIPQLRRLGTSRRHSPRCASTRRNGPRRRRRPGRPYRRPEERRTSNG